MGHSDFRSSSLHSTSKLLLCVYNLDRPFRWFSMSILFSSFELAFLSFFTLFSFTNWINPNYYHFMNIISYQYYPKLKQEVPIAEEYDNWLAWKGKKCSLVSVLTRFDFFFKSLWFHKIICQNLVCWIIESFENISSNWSSILCFYISVAIYETNFVKTQ